MTSITRLSVGCAAPIKGRDGATETAPSAVSVETVAPRTTEKTAQPTFTKLKTKDKSMKRKINPIFKNTAWAKFWAICSTPDIHANRKRFAEDFRLTEHLGCAWPPHIPDIQYDFEATELYADAGGGFVLAISNWSNRPPEPAWQMVETDPLTNFRVRSFCRRFEDRESLNRFSRGK